MPNPIIGRVVAAAMLVGATLPVAAAPPSTGQSDDTAATGYGANPALASVERDLDAGLYEKAEVALQNELALSPPSADIYSLLGFANRKLKRYQRARQYYDKALAMEPAHLNALEYLGELELETGNPDAARAILSRLKAACPGDCPQRNMLRSAFAAVGVPEDGAQTH